MNTEDDALEGVETIKQKGMEKKVLKICNQMEQRQSTIYSRGSGDDLCICLCVSGSGCVSGCVCACVPGVCVTYLNLHRTLRAQ